MTEAAMGEADLRNLLAAICDLAPASPSEAELQKVDAAILAWGASVRTVDNLLASPLTHISWLALRGAPSDADVLPSPDLTIEENAFRLLVAGHRVMFLTHLGSVRLTLGGFARMQMIDMIIEALRLEEQHPQGTA